MYLTDEQQAILNGSKGETMAKVMKTLVMYGDTFGADKMVPVTSAHNHLVTSFGLKMMKPVFDLMQQLIDAGAISQQQFSVDPRPVDKNVPANFLQNFIFVIAPALALSGFIKNPDCIWIALIVAEVLTSLAIFGLAAYYKHGVPYRFEDFLFVKDSFGIAPENTFEFSLDSRDAIVPASEAVRDFCDNKGADEKVSYLMSLFVEELCTNVIDYGFTDGKKHSIDIRIIKLEDGWVLRYIDNCKMFDPTEWLKVNDEDDPEKNIGIRMISGMAKDVKYLSTMELNNLTITL